jgi:hypothetical protein
LKILSTDEAIVALKLKCKGLKQAPLPKGLEKRKCTTTIVSLSSVRIIQTSKTGQFNLLDKNMKYLFKGAESGKDHHLNAQELLVGFISQTIANQLKYKGLVIWTPKIV